MYNKPDVIHDHLNALQKEMWDKYAEDYNNLNNLAYNDVVMEVGPSQPDNLLYMQLFVSWSNNPTVKTISYLDD
ncbi:hypothetical protein JZU46_06595 [bacterium]|nr:hypothetical protein [bacterium]